jgi:hypothetical protein
VQTTGFEPLQAPTWQVSVWVQALPSLQAVPFGFATAEHEPLDGLQVPVLQGSVSPLQSTVTPFLQVSVVRSHVSTPLQALPSSHAASAVHWQALVFTVQPPADSLQLSTVQAIPSLHTRAGPPQTPAAQVSGVVHALASSHADPSAFVGFEHAPVEVLQVPAV